MTAEQMWAPLRQGSVSDLIAERIMQVIADDSLRPGDRLPPERELAALLGVGRPSLREALRSLKAQGKVDVRHGAGVFVADPETTRNLREALYAEEVDLEELFDMREVLELPAAAWAARNGDAVKLERVREAFETLNAASLEGGVDWRHLQSLDAAFHMRIVEAAGNRFLARTQGVLQEILSRGMDTTLRIPGRLERSRADHRRILDAILAGDSSAARRAARAHVHGARKAALSRKREEIENLLTE
ncbi:FadR/GntR family transcriptional regulator [Rhodococcus opacus]|uniref:FadR/GntR family transcriptional regulator n=1 Tax=Rhodococcus opacus TaxID=37919 RepID=UPI002476E02F|nr:FadR/GntR family transcriptional regulator [Rhodococcus opacus]MDH6291350.1 GntR family transcriptional repressor for pyruvate dehydrogenase complex [Rhodococcus opacus]